MSVPAVIFWEPDLAGIEIAGLTLLDRLVVAAHRAGGEPVYLIGTGSNPPLKRARSLGIDPLLASIPPRLSGPVLILECRALVETPDLRRLIEHGGRLATRTGTPLPIAVIPTMTGQLIDTTAGGTDQGWEKATSSRQASMIGLANVCAEGVAVPVSDRRTAGIAERCLWASLASNADGWVDRYFNRPVGRPLSRLLVRTPATPNMVSILATLIGLVSALMFGLGTQMCALWGAVLLQISAVMDCVDGDLARVSFKESSLGRWLDIVGDQIVHVCLFVGIGIGLWRGGSDAPVLALGMSAGSGVVIAFAVVMRGMLRQDIARNSRWKKLIDATTNRDFSVLVILLTVLGALEMFLWAAAIGVHVFWIVALAVQYYKPSSLGQFRARHEKGV